MPFHLMYGYSYFSVTVEVLGVENIYLTDASLNGLVSNGHIQSSFVEYGVYRCGIATVRVPHTVIIRQHYA